MSDKDAANEADRDQIAALEDFEAKFKSEDFADVAHVLGLSGEEPETLLCLREHLVPEFRFFVESCSGPRLSREDRIERLGNLRRAAAALSNSLAGGGAIADLPRSWFSELV